MVTWRWSQYFFYHAMVSQRRAISGIKIMEIDGVLSEDQLAIENHIIDYYK